MNRGQHAALRRLVDAWPHGLPVGKVNSRRSVHEQTAAALARRNLAVVSGDVVYATDAGRTLAECSAPINGTRADP